MRRNTLLRQGRTCYDHLAGVVGVQLLEALLQRGWLEESAGPRPRYRLTPSGRQASRAVALLSQTPRKRGGSLPMAVLTGQSAGRIWGR